MFTDHCGFVSTVQAVLQSSFLLPEKPPCAPGIHSALGTVCSGALTPASQPDLPGTDVLVKEQLWGAGGNLVAVETSGISPCRYRPVMCLN